MATQKKNAKKATVKDDDYDAALRELAAGRVRVKYLNGPRKGSIQVVNQRQAQYLEAAGRVTIL